MPAWWLVGAGVGYGVSVIRSGEPLTSKDRYLSMNNLLWAGGVSTLMWRNMVIARGTSAWIAPRVLPATAYTAGRLWALGNYVRLGAPMAVGGGTGIGFGAASGGIGAANFGAALASTYIIAAVAGTGISYALWGQKGARQAMDFYSGGALFGTQPNYYGTADDPGYFNVPGNVLKIIQNW